MRMVVKARRTERNQVDADFGLSSKEDADEDKYADVAGAVGQKQTWTTVQNLCIREDTAKYLIT